MADARDLKSRDLKSRAGSSPALGTALGEKMERNGYRHKVDEFRIAMKSLQKTRNVTVKF